MAWFRMITEADLAQRDVNRELTALIPLLFDAPLADVDWPDRRVWDVRDAADVGLREAELLALAARMGRVLVTCNSAFLDDARFPPDSCPGVIVVGAGWHTPLDQFLVTIVGLLGPFRSLYHGLKVHGDGAGTITITAPAGRTRRITRRFVMDREGLPRLSELQSSDAGKHEVPGYRRGSARPWLMP